MCLVALCGGADVSSRVPRYLCCVGVRVRVRVRVGLVWCLCGAVWVPGFDHASLLPQRCKHVAPSAWVSPPCLSGRRSRGVVVVVVCVCVKCIDVSIDPRVAGYCVATTCVWPCVCVRVCVRVCVCACVCGGVQNNRSWMWFASLRCVNLHRTTVPPQHLARGCRTACWKSFTKPSHG